MIQCTFATGIEERRDRRWFKSAGKPGVAGTSDSNAHAAAIGRARSSYILFGTDIECGKKKKESDPKKQMIPTNSPIHTINALHIKS